MKAIIELWVGKEEYHYWYKNGHIHRDVDSPAIIHSNGTKYWFKENHKHRENNLPAVVYYNGIKEWWVNGKKIRKE